MLVLLLALAAQAQTAPGVGTGIDAMESLFGATNVHAITGHGRVSAGISRDGDVTVLTWPSPSRSDQLAYLSSNALDARLQPRFGAPEGAGIVLGLLVEEDGERSVLWMREGEVEQGHGPADGANVHTMAFFDDPGVSLLVEDAVSPGADVLVRDVTLIRHDDSEVDVAWLLTYANLSPVPPTSRIPELPIADWVFDGRNDFAAAWDGSAVVAWHPDDERIVDGLGDVLAPPSVDWGPVGSAMDEAEPDVAALLGEVGEQPGAWAVLSTVPAPDAWQVGQDGTPWCDHLDGLVDNLLALPEVYPDFALPVPPEVLGAVRCGSGPPVHEAQGWTYLGDDPWADAADGDLQGHDLAAGETAQALRTPLTFEGQAARATVVLGFGADLAAARAAHDTGATTDVPAEAEAVTLDWLDGQRIPGEGLAHTVARRSLLNVRVGTDAATGAVVASISRQPPYGLDWPRDGAFFDLMLDAAGQTELVERRLDLYAAWQRDEPVEATPVIDPDPPEDPDFGEVDTYPAGGWEMNYFPDGTPGGNLRFEIDTTAFAVWTMVVHAGWAEDPEASLRARWDSIAAGADLLARWKDPATGLHAPAQEDDQPQYSQTLHGAITTFGALDVAARAARLLGRDQQAIRWETRAIELREAIFEHFWDEERGRLAMTATGRGPFVASGRIPVGPGAWATWPLRVFAWSDPRLVSQIEADHAQIAETMRLENEGGAYFMKGTVAHAVAAGHLWQAAPLAHGQSAVLATHAAPGTHHFGEVMVNVDGFPDQRTANPHLWEGALFWLTVLAEEDPHALERWEEVLPPSRVVPDRPCGCRSSGSAGWVPVLMALAWIRRRGA